MARTLLMAALAAHLAEGELMQAEPKRVAPGPRGVPILALARFPLGEAPRTVHALVQPLATKRRIVLVPPEGDACLLAIVGDESKVTQITYNLLSNAVKLTRDGGRVAVTAEATDEGVVVSVIDNGIGIRPEDQARIFAELEQVDSSHARRQRLPLRSDSAVPPPSGRR